MAAFRLAYLPTAAASSSSHAHLFLPFPPPPNPCRLSLSTKLRRLNFRLYLVHAQDQAQPVVQSEENAVEEEDGVLKTRLLVQNVPWTCTADDIRPLFEKYGTVVDIELIMYAEERNKGFGFVSMDTHEQAVAALSNLESTEFEGRVLRLKWAKLKKPKPLTMPNPPKPPPGHNLFVANIAYKAGFKDLKDFFIANNANVVSGKIIYHDNPRRPSGYGFVAFNTEAEAEAALVAFDGKEFMGRQIRVRRSKRFCGQATKATLESESAQVA